jgi:hypothetical protein
MEVLFYTLDLLEILIPMECSKTNKKCYQTYQEAYDRLNYLRIKKSNEERNGHECRIYACKFCGCFHLTHTQKNSLKPKPIPLKTEESTNRAKRILKKGEKND